MKHPLIIVLLTLLSLCDVVHSSCNICGDGKEVGNPDAVVMFNTVPPSETPCGKLQSMGKAGLIPDAQCGRLPQYLGDTCECRVPEPETSAIAEKSSTNGATKSGKKTSSKATKGSKSSKIFASKASTKSSKGKGTTSGISAGAKSTKEKVGGTTASTASSSSAATTAKPTGTKSSKSENESSKVAKLSSAKSGKGDSSKEVGAKSGSYKSKAGGKK